MRIAVIGVGLIGGSIALAARQRLGAEVWGLDRDPGVLEAALREGVLDRGCDTADEALTGAQAAFVAVPVGAVPRSVDLVLEHAAQDCVVTDVGSTKRAIVAAHDDPRFIGGHPLAGSERPGIGHARPDMFQHATWYLTPTANTEPALLERLARLLQGIGARPVMIDPGDHDRVVATVSHLPHVLANVLVAQAGTTLPASELTPSAGGPSFRDATRVAGAAGEIWTDIYMANADLLALAIEDVVEQLGAFRQALLEGDRARVASIIESAAAVRARLGERTP